MSNGFDPYETWLGIPAAEQPANLFRLLGLSADETAYATITTAADQRMARVKTFQKGAQASVAQAIIAELLHARVTLSDERRRTAYNTLLAASIPAATCDSHTLPAEQTRSEAVENDSLVGSRIDKYRIWERYSSSPRGTLLAAQHVDTNRRYYLRQLPLEADDDRDLQKAFQREAEVLTKLDHPHWLCARTSGFCDGQSYLVLDYVAGVDLAQVVQLQGKLPVEDAIRYVAQAARGLEALHKQGLTHRNVRPQTLLLDVQGKIRLVNPLLGKLGEPFTLALRPDQVKANTPGSSVYEFLPPEQADDPRKVEPRADIYALGCVLAFLLLGRAPYPGKTAAQQILAHKNAPIPSLRQVRSDIPIALDNTFIKMVNKQPALRYATVADMVEDLEASATRGNVKLPPKDNLWVQWMKRLGIRK